MSDEQERAEPPAPEETPPAPQNADGPPPTADGGPGPATAEPAAPAAEAPAPQEPAVAPSQEAAPQKPAEPPAEGATAEAASEPAAQEAKPAEAAPPAKEQAAPASPPSPPSPPPTANYDGLDSGLAWFGFERFEPPAPVGYEPSAVEAPPRPPKELSVEERRRIHGRAAARRQEVETQKAWYQKIPMGALSMVPILVVLIVYAIIYPPWGGGALPKSREPLDEQFLSAQPLATTSEALRQLGVTEATPDWRLLPGNVLMMTKLEPNAKVAFAIPRGLVQAEISCDLCIVDRDANAWGASLAADGAAVLALQAHPTEPGKDWVAGRRLDNRLGGFTHEITPRMWNTVKLVVDSAGTNYYFNGKKLSAAGPRPAVLTKADLTTYNTRLLLRNWRVQVLK